MPSREACLIRPMAEEDLDLVLVWRNSERIRAVSYTDHVIGIEEHRAWFERADAGQSTLPLVFECEGRPVGVVNATAVDRGQGSCTWGFYIGAEDAPRGAGRAMGYCALEYLFERIDLRTVRGEALASNEVSIRWQQGLGFEKETVLPAHAEKHGKREDVVVLGMSATTWRETRDALFESTFGGGRERRT